jgi:hypothetical protein
VTSYDPNPSIFINSVAIDPGIVIDDISVNMGRPNILEQPAPGYARVILWTTADDAIDVQLGQELQIKVQTPSAGDTSIFNGIISDIGVELAQYGDKGSITTYILTAVGPLASLNHKNAGTVGYAKEYDGTRILNILTEAFLTEWDDVSPTLTWNDLPTDVTWDFYDGINSTLVASLTTDIDAPGVYELKAYNDGTANALLLAQEAAQSGRGVLSEHGDGSIHYDDLNARQGFTTLNLTADDILASGLKTAAQWSEIVNDVTVTYRAGEANARDEQSIILYGQLTGKRETTLHNLLDAEGQADAFKEARAYPRVYPEQFIIPLHSPTVSDATRDALADVYCGLPITTSNLPAVFGTTFEGYVEGWSWAIRQKQAILTLIASAQSETYPSILWYQLPSGQTWTAYPNLVKWEDL